MPPARPHHRFHIQGHHGPLTIQAAATLGAPWTVLFGPSGSGKSTLLRALAGLVPTLRATFDRYIPNTNTWQPLTALPAHHRQLAYDPQQTLLLPHLTVEQNIRFPEMLRSTPAHDSQLSTLAELVDLKPLLRKRPDQLSGGERQRVSLARALAVPHAKLLLLDEPFSGLDRAYRDELLPRLQAQLVTRNLPVLSVTHDPDEALLLRAEVLRLHEGQLSPAAPASEALAEEIRQLRKLLPNP